MVVSLSDLKISMDSEKAEEPEIANIRWIMEKARELQKNIYFCFIDYAKAFDCVDHIIQKQRHYFANKRPSSQGYGFPVVMYGYESWTVKKAEHQRIDAFEHVFLFWKFH